MSFGQILRKLRTDRDLLQKDVANYLECSIKTISAYETDKKKPPMETLQKLADFYGVSVDYLLGTENSFNDLEKHFPNGVMVLRRANDKLSDDQKEKMIQLMEWFLENEIKKGDDK